MKVAAELLPERVKIYRHLYPSVNMIEGDITEKETFDSIIAAAQKEKCNFLIATPPCQGMSVAGKNRHHDTMVNDKRNYLVNYVFDTIERIQPSFVLIENVPMLLKFRLPYKNEMHNVLEILCDKFGNSYNIDGKVVDSAEYGVPQTRLRAIIKMYKIGNEWPWPQPVETKVTLRDAIGNLPSLEAGESSNT